MINKNNRHTILKSVLIGMLLCSLFVLSSCTVAPPSHPDNICKIFKQYPRWYWAAQRTEAKWGIPIPVQMAVIHQESHFQASVKPPRRKLLGFIPWLRQSTASGYSQALESTWCRYENDIGKSARRSCFGDASDFVGWYLNKIHRKTGIPKTNTYALYLAYHEGAGGYNRRSYRKKPWLMVVAQKVSYRARRYDAQLKKCRHCLPKRHFWNIF